MGGQSPKQSGQVRFSGLRTGRRKYEKTQEVNHYYFGLIGEPDAEPECLRDKTRG